jgi:hypothetical protein
VTARPALVLLAVAAALAWPASGSANGDPASDTLLVQDLFIPYEGISTDSEKEIKDALAEAKKRGHPIRVALIASKSDLGLVPGLWRKPQPYAKLLWTEMAFSYRGPVLTVMPNGIGYYDQGGKGVGAAQAKFEGIQIPQNGPDGLAHAGASAVRVFAGLKPLPNESGGGGGTTTRDRILIAAVSALLIAGLILASSRVYRRRIEAAKSPDV